MATGLSLRNFSTLYVAYFAVIIDENALTFNIDMQNYVVDMGDILDVYGLSNIVKTPTCF